MELTITLRETSGSLPNQYNETIVKFEIMDCAVRSKFCACLSFVLGVSTEAVSFQGETIPIRVFFGGFDLTPTFRDVNKKFTTRFYLNLVLIVSSLEYQR